MSEKDNQKVYFGDKKVSKDIKKDGVEEIFTKAVSYTHLTLPTTPYV